VLTGNKDTDAVAFIDAFMELLIPTKVQNKKDAAVVIVRAPS